MLNLIIARLKNILNNKGQGLVEYVLIIALIAIGLVVILGSTSTAVSNIFQNIIDTLTDAITP